MTSCLFKEHAVLQDVTGCLLKERAVLQDVTGCLAQPGPHWEQVVGTIEAYDMLAVVSVVSRTASVLKTNLKGMFFCSL